MDPAAAVAMSTVVALAIVGSRHFVARLVLPARDDLRRFQGHQLEHDQLCDRWLHLRLSMQCLPSYLHLGLPEPWVGQLEPVPVARLRLALVPAEVEQLGELARVTCLDRKRRNLSMVKIVLPFCFSGADYMYSDIDLI